MADVHNSGILLESGTNRSPPHWAMPVATPSEPPDTVLSGLWMSVQEMRLMPTTVYHRYRDAPDGRPPPDQAD